MIQILGLRSFIPKDSKDGKQKTFDKVFPMPFPVPSVEFVFQNIDKILAEIPKDEHWNLFYTIANCETYTGKKEEKRAFVSTEMLAFDLDGLDRKYMDQYIAEMLTVLGVDSTKIGMVSSGNGLHFLLKLDHVISDEKFFKQNRAHYKAVCTKIDTALEIAGIPGKMDVSIFDARRILRLPETVNRKVDKPETTCALLQPITGSVHFDLIATGGLPVVAENDQVGKRLLKHYQKVPSGPVLEGCDFLKHCTDHADSIPEPLWYAALSITARLEGEAQNGYPASHDLSRGHHGYTSEGTDQKIEQALDASGPRTCAAIKQLWDGCSKCKHFEKVTSPIQIVGEGTIRTEHTGFHNIPEKGKPKPNYEDLKKFFERQYIFKTLGGSKMVFVWTGTHYKQMEEPYIENFAQTHFNPFADSKMTREFASLLMRENIKDVSWWHQAAERKMNFLNGYLDFDTGEFLAHTSEVPFRYVLPYNYDPDAKAPRFKKMMQLITGGDGELIKVIEEFFGYCLSNDTCWAQQALVLVGEGQNGKSTLLDTLKMLAGEDNYSPIVVKKLGDEYNLAVLDGKLFNIAEETNAQGFLDNSTFKNLATGGTFVARMIYKKPYSFTNKTKMLITCNELPQCSDNSDGFYRRLIIAPFLHKIDKTAPDYDPFLLEKLKEELPGIFNSLLAGYRRLKTQKKFTEAQSASESLLSYRMENDTVLYWATENLKIHHNGTFESYAASVGDLYEAYVNSMKAERRPILDKARFEKRLPRFDKELWGDHPYHERSTRKYITINGKMTQVRVVKGVEIPN